MSIILAASCRRRLKRRSTVCCTRRRAGWNSAVVAIGHPFEPLALLVRVVRPMGGDHQSSWGEGQRQQEVGDPFLGRPGSDQRRGEQGQADRQKGDDQARAVTVWSVLEPSCLLGSSTVVTCRSAALRPRVETILFDRPESVTESVTRRESLKDATARRLSALVDWERWSTQTEAVG